MRTGRPHTLLLTGPPRIGKSTLIRRVADALGGSPIRGFITDEVLEGGKRVGFQLNTFDGPSFTMAHTRIRSPHRIGKYGVDVAAIDHAAASSLAPAEDADVYLIDEIGPMECLSGRFVAAMRALLDSDSKIVATIHRGSGGFVGAVKGRSDVLLRQVTEENRDAMVERVLAWIRRG